MPKISHCNGQYILHLKINILALIELRVHGKIFTYSYVLLHIYFFYTQDFVIYHSYYTLLSFIVLFFSCYSNSHPNPLPTVCRSFCINHICLLFSLFNYQLGLYHQHYYQQNLHILFYHPLVSVILCISSTNQ